MNESKRAPRSTNDPDALGDAFEYCAAEVRAYDPDRFFSALFAPPSERRTLFALYAFNLEIAKTRETVSEPMLGRIRLQWWREALDGVYAADPRQHTVVLALTEAVASAGLSRALLDEMIDGRERDLEAEPFASIDDLTAYASASSGALVCLALEALGAGQAVQAGRAAGIVHALCGLVRAVPHHRAQGASYLPGLPANAISPDDPAVREAVGDIVRAGEVHRKEAAGLFRSLPNAARPALLPAAPVGSDLGRLGRAGHDPFAASYAGPFARRLRTVIAHRTGRL